MKRQKLRNNGLIRCILENLVQECRSAAAKQPSLRAAPQEGRKSRKKCWKKRQPFAAVIFTLPGPGRRSMKISRTLPWPIFTYSEIPFLSMAIWQRFIDRNVRICGY
ncbi:hypothetical protein [Phaeovulum sp. W22_SRMD_FR3]|uniref:hypothetical protein n=1 Tax=Phaeovulum sp. W22_SRMD_FR3 TaxID=3240274 RepID=UPI003F995C45